MSLVDLGACGRLPSHKLFELFLETRDDSMITLYQTRGGQTLGSWVYDGAATLARYLEAFMIYEGDTETPRDLSAKSVLELGAGTGIVGFLLGHYGAQVTITDLDGLVPLLQYNLDKNRSVMRGDVTVKTLCWGQDDLSEFGPRYDYLILANCVYYEGSLEVLADTVRTFADSRTVVYACYEERTPSIENLVAKWHHVISESFDIEEVPKEYHRNLGQLDCVTIVKMTKK